MTLLLDTCTFLWILAEPRKLSAKAAQIFHDPANRFLVSVVSEWEVAVQASLGRLQMGQPVEAIIPAKRLQHGIDLLDLTESAALYVPKLPRIHRDPFDRMLICQAIIEGIPLLTPDRLIAQYPVTTLW
jgi:PIN domain nuclease of toxin-antitoxin system